jgi:hypothetical protein
MNGIYGGYGTYGYWMCPTCHNLYPGWVACSLASCITQQQSPTWRYPLPKPEPEPEIEPLEAYILGEAQPA